MKSLPCFFLLFALVFIPSCQANRFNSEIEFASRLASLELWQEAYDRWERALAVEGNKAYLLNNMAVALEAMGRLEQAAEKYDLALNLEPNNQQIQNNRQRLTRLLASGLKQGEKQ